MPRRLIQNPMHRALERMGLAGDDFADMAGALGTTPRHTIYTQGTLKLQHYVPQVDNVYRVPVLIVTSLVNQPYILDMVPGQSMVEYLLQQGFDVYMIEWGRVRQEHKNLTLEDHVLAACPPVWRRFCSTAARRSCPSWATASGGLLSAFTRHCTPQRHLKT